MTVNENLYQPPKSDISVESDTNYEYAGFWVRVGATIIDSILMFILTWPLLILIYGDDFWVSESLIQGVWDVLLSYVFPAVVIVIFWLYKSATPGKMLFGLRVISLGERPSLSKGQAVGRYLSYYISSLPLLLGFIWVAFDKRKQGWHDQLANTAVIKVPKSI